MNVGYNKVFGKVDDVSLMCPLCGADIYASNDVIDFRCVNSECDLHAVSPYLLAKQIQRILLMLKR